MTFLIGLLVLLAVVGVSIIILYNQLVGLPQLVDNGWSDIDVQLKRRSDLIPRLVSTVKGYAAHERKLFTEITEKRNQSLAAGNNLAERQQAETALSRPLSRLMAVAEDYPDLKASDNFLELHNGATRGLNTKVQSFPANLIAGMFGFDLREYFEIGASDAALPDVEFEGSE
jgi:LemA protein